MRMRPAASAAFRASARKAPSGSSLSQPRVFCSASKAASEISASVGVAAGGLAGMVSALTGVGGGLILIPIMARFTTLTQQSINGTSIGAVSVAASVGAYNYLSVGACNAPMALMTTIPAIICTRYGVRTAHQLSSKKLSLVVGSAMLLFSPLIVLKKSPYFPKWNENQHPLDLQFYGMPLKHGETTPYIERVQANLPDFAVVNAKYLAAGAFAGFISGLCGLGGGILMTAYLTAASDMPQEHIIGTSLLSIVPTAVASTYHNVRAKSIHLPTAVKVGGALAVGVYGTSKYVTHHVPEDALRGILAGTLGSAALVMMRRAL